MSEIRAALMASGVASPTSSEGKELPSSPSRELPAVPRLPSVGENEEEEKENGNSSNSKQRTNRRGSWRLSDRRRSSLDL